MDRIKVAGPVRGLHVAFTALILSIVLMASGVGAFFYLSQQAVSDSCNSIRTNNQILRTLLIRAEDMQLKAIKIGAMKGSPSAVHAFFDSTINELNESKC